MKVQRVPFSRRRVALALIACLAAGVAACGDDGPTGVSEESLAGSWSGTTSQGRTISFTVAGGSVTQLTIGFFIQGSFCTTDGEVTVTGGEPIVDASVSSDITFTDPDIHIEGTFTSSSAASGTVSFSSGQCNGSASASWTASKGAGGSATSSSLTGTWQGVYSTSLVPTAMATATLIQNGSSLSGSFVGSNNYTASISGSVSGSTVQFTLTSTVPGCSGSFSGSGSVSGGRTLTATFSGNDCLGSHSNGSVSLTKQ